MSCSRGNEFRTRAQKHKNRTVFKNDLHDKTPLQIRLNAMQICEVCQPCKAIIEWKIKYKKYKPLPKPKTCVKCQERNVKKAYHVLCKGCAKINKVCPKCMKSSKEVEIEPAVPTPEEELKLKVEMDRLIKLLPERKRRSFLRYMENGQTIELDSDIDPADAASKNDADDNSNMKQPKTKRIQHTRDELLNKIKQLTVTEENDLSNDSDSDDDDDNDNQSSNTDAS